MKGIIPKLKKLFHKAGVNRDDWDKLHPNAVALAEYVYFHCENYNFQMVITSIKRPRISKVSKTDIHASSGFYINAEGEKIEFEGRAWDMSVLNWQLEDIYFLRDNVNRIFSTGAYSTADGVERECVYEPAEYDENGKQTKWPHLHFQCRINPS